MNEKALKSLFDIKIAIHEIDSFLPSGKLTLSKYKDNRILKRAVERNLEIIGEAVKNLSEEFRNKHNEIEWKKIAGFRDVIIHKYFEVDLDVVWSIIEKDLPVLKDKLEKVKK